MSDTIKCENCKNYNMKTKRCPYLGKECYRLSSHPYSMFTEADKGELSMREAYRKQHEGSSKRSKLSDIVHILLVVVFVIWVMISVGIVGYGWMYRLSNPELTQTQLILWSYREFWWYYLITIGGWLGISIFINKL